MQVGFTKHAADRFSQRLGIKIRLAQEVNIKSAFTLAKTYNHTETNRKMEAWCYNDITQKIVLIIDAENRNVITVYTGALDDVYGTNMIAACYAIVAKKQQLCKH